MENPFLPELLCSIFPHRGRVGCNWGANQNGDSKLLNGDERIQPCYLLWHSCLLHIYQSHVCPNYSCIWSGKIFFFFRWAKDHFKERKKPRDQPKLIQGEYMKGPKDCTKEERLQKKLTAPKRKLAPCTWEKNTQKKAYTGQI